MERPEEPRPPRPEEPPVSPIGTPVDSLPDDPSPAGAIAKKPLTIPPRPARAPAIVDELLTNEVEGALPARAQSSRGPMLIAVVVALIIVGLAAWGVEERGERQRAKRRFLATCERASATAVLRQAEELPQWLRDDAEVVAALGVVRARVASEQARAAAVRSLARLDSVATLDGWRTVCDQAAAVDPTWGEPLARRAEATLALARGKASKHDETTFQAVKLEADRELDLALAREPAQRTEYLLRRARLYLMSAQGDLEERRRVAGAAAAEALRSAPVDTVPWLLASARLKWLSDDWARVVELCDRALVLEPERADAYLLRAEAKLRLGHLFEAIEDARNARARERWSIDAVLVEVESRSLGPRVLGDAGRAPLLEELARVLDFDPTHARALAARAYVRLERDRVGVVKSSRADRLASFNDAERALRFDPTQPLAHAALAELAFASSDRAATSLAANRAVEHGPHLSDLFLLRGRLRARLGDLGALDDFDAVLRLRPMDARAHTNRAAVLLAQGKVDPAKRAAAEALLIDASLPEAYFQRGLAAYKAVPREAQHAVDDFSRALSLDRGMADAWFYRACALYDARMCTEALQDLDRAETARLERGSFRQGDAYLLRGHCLFRLRRWSDAQAAYGEYQRRARPGSVPAKLTDRLTLLRSIISGQVDGETIDVENH